MKELSWDEIYNLLVKYLKNNNNIYPFKKEIYDDFELGKWVNEQQDILLNGEESLNGDIVYCGKVLYKNQIDKLENINFKLKTTRADRFAEDWNNKFNLLKEYLELNNGLYPTQDVVYKNVSLGTWVATQRLTYCKGNKQPDGSIKYNRHILLKERIDKLNEIGFNWIVNISIRHDKSWNEKYEVLIEYLDNNSGNFPVQSTVYNGVMIGAWISEQRNIYNNGVKNEKGELIYKGSKLTDERIKKLNDINFEWKTSVAEVYDKNWNKKYEILKEYLDEHDGKFPKQTESYKGVRIGAWVSLQRVIYASGTKKSDGSYVYRKNVITPEQLAKLKEINFVWFMYTYSDYTRKIDNEKKKSTINRKILLHLKNVLEDSKNEIDNKEDLSQISEKFEKVLINYE